MTRMNCLKTSQKTTIKCRDSLVLRPLVVPMDTSEQVKDPMLVTIGWARTLDVLTAWPKSRTIQSWQVKKVECPNIQIIDLKVIFEIISFIEIIWNFNLQLHLSPAALTAILLPSISFPFLICPKNFFGSPSLDVTFFSTGATSTLSRERALLFLRPDFSIYSFFKGVLDSCLISAV